jgi:hypothetical protein
MPSQTALPSEFRHLPSFLPVQRPEGLGSRGHQRLAGFGSPGPQIAPDIPPGPECVPCPYYMQIR